MGEGRKRGEIMAVRSALVSASRLSIFLVGAGSAVPLQQGNERSSWVLAAIAVHYVVAAVEAEKFGRNADFDAYWKADCIVLNWI